MNRAFVLLPAPDLLSGIATLVILASLTEVAGAMMPAAAAAALPLTEAAIAVGSAPAAVAAPLTEAVVTIGSAVAGGCLSATGTLSVGEKRLPVP